MEREIMSNTKIISILGGMGPKATVELFRRNQSGQRKALPAAQPDRYLMDCHTLSSKNLSENCFLWYTGE